MARLQQALNMSSRMANLFSRMMLGCQFLTWAGVYPPHGGPDECAGSL